MGFSSLVPLGAYMAIVVSLEKQAGGTHTNVAQATMHTPAHPVTPTAMPNGPANAAGPPAHSQQATEQAEKHAMPAKAK